MDLERCGCRCHELTDGPFIEPRLTDPLAAVSACVLCRNAHVLALTDEERPEPPQDPPLLPPFSGDTD